MRLGLPWGGGRSGSAAPLSLAPETVAKVSGFAQQQQDLLAVADSFAPKLRAAFIKAVNALQDETSLKALASALQAGDLAAVSALVGYEKLGVGLARLADAIQAAFTLAGISTATLAAEGAAGLKVAVRFDAMNPRAVAYARKYTYDLITSITESTREAVGRMVARNVRTGRNPQAAARAIKQVIGLTPQQATALANYREHLEGGRWGSALNYDVGRGAENSIEAAAAKGFMKPERIEALVERYRQRQLRRRASMIAHTESMRAVSNGNNEAWRQVMEASGLDARVFRRYWIATADDKTRPDHVSLPEINAKGVGMFEPFRLPSGGFIMFPHDPNAPAEQTINCRCTVFVRIEEVAALARIPILPGRSILPAGSQPGLKP